MANGPNLVQASVPHVLLALQRLATLRPDPLLVGSHVVVSVPVPAVLLAVHTVNAWVNTQVDTQVNTIIPQLQLAIPSMISVYMTNFCQQVMG